MFRFCFSIFRGHQHALSATVLLSLQLKQIMQRNSYGQIKQIAVVFLFSFYGLSEIFIQLLVMI